MIAYLGWGSLIWNPGGLCIPKTEPPEDAWCPDGPELPVEFGRRSSRGRVTLVIAAGARTVRTFWAICETDDLVAARESLRVRETIALHRSGQWVADWRGGEPRDAYEAVISKWARRRQLSSVVWTSLPPKWSGSDGVMPNERQVLDYLEQTRGKVRALAEEYVRKTPRQIRTAYREAIEARLSWTPIGRV